MVNSDWRQQQHQAPSSPPTERVAEVARGAIFAISVAQITRRTSSRLRSVQARGGPRSVVSSTMSPSPKHATTAATFAETGSGHPASKKKVHFICVFVRVPYHRVPPARNVSKDSPRDVCSSWPALGCSRKHGRRLPNLLNQ